MAEEALQLLVVLAALGLGVTKIVDLIRNAVDEAGRAPKWTWNVVAIVVGVGMVYLGSDVTVPEMFARIEDWQARILLGVLAGAGGGFWHELLDRWSSQADAAQAKAAAARVETG